MWMTEICQQRTNQGRLSDFRILHRADGCATEDKQGEREVLDSWAKENWEVKKTVLRIRDMK